ncbi:MAG TPA: isocitrate lyase/phosphoenolpyruvate mutase family protein [Polyangiaceae bacterium]|nr:isocitrate lyase/phosphoenolpyruvate mutase family protein [Polyangiaceae bacterium]
MPTIADRRSMFRAMHESGCFLLPNPWDVGSARYLQHLGFKALATTSAGFAFSQGRPDNAVPRGMMLDHIRAIVEATDVPVNADFEGGYAHSPEGVAESVRMCVATGVSGLSIEDSNGEGEEPLYAIDHAVARIRAARAAIDEMGDAREVVLTGRSEGFLVGRPDLDATIRRLKAYAEAGADCVYAPGVRSREAIAAIVQAVAPKPVNVLMGAPSDLTVADLTALGARRVSVGGGLARAAWGGFTRTARALAETGRFDAFADAAPHGELNHFFLDDLAKRQR